MRQPLWLAALLLAVVLLAVGLGCSGATTGGAARPPAATGTDAGPRVMVTLKPAPPPLVTRIVRELAEIHRLRLVFSWPMASLDEQCVVFEVPPGREAGSLVRRLASDPRVSLAQPVQQFDVLASPPAYNDPYAHLQPGVQALRLAQAHRWATGRGVRVAVIDTGVDLDHPDLRGRVVKASNFVDRGEHSFTSDFHGTAVVGVIAAAANNEVGIVGVAPQAEIFALKACWQRPPEAREAVCDSYTLAKAIDFATTERIQVLNFSLAGPNDPLLTRLIGAALARGIVVIAADGRDAARPFPATLPGVIGVANPSLGGMGRRGDPPLAAPAVDILTTVPRGSYDFFSGSSFAAAQVSGVAALLLEREPKLTPAQLAALFRKTAKLLPAQAGNDGAAFVQVDACAALASALGTGPCS
jgi:subtilisin family serine protease